MQYLRCTRILLVTMMASWTWEPEVPIFNSAKKLHANISTESEIGIVDDVLTQVIWTQYFLKEQVYEIHDNVIYQDKHSAIKLDNKGIQSSSKRNKHINIRYYFIADRNANQETSISLYPILDMLGDYFTKALQGYQFRRFHSIILDVHEGYIPSYNVSIRSLPY